MSLRKSIKLNFFCVGVQKAGTTLLHDILKQHSNIFLPEEKEAHFFDVNECYSMGLDYFLKTYYKPYAGEKIIGNINPNLQIESRSIDRIIESFGRDLKVILILRDPVRRAYSHFLMSKKRGYEDLEFNEAIKKEEERIKAPVEHKDYESRELAHFEKNHFGYISRGIYSPIIKRLFKSFESKNIKVYIFEEFVKQKEETIRDIFKFLEVKSENLNLTLKSNPAQKAKSHNLSKFLNTHSTLKSILKSFVPKFVRQPIKAFVNQKNLTEIDKQTHDNPYNYQLIRKKYFEEDIKKVELLLGRKIDVWS